MDAVWRELKRSNVVEAAVACAIASSNERRAMIAPTPAPPVRPRRCFLSPALGAEPQHMLLHATEGSWS